MHGGLQELEECEEESRLIESIEESQGNFCLISR